jgi:class 3 adenylate cyclase
MRCPSCHHQNRSDRRFCTQCGTTLAVGCPSCGAPIETGENFCGGCGAALTIRGKTTPPSPAHTPIRSEKIRQAKTTVEGERKQVTVLFVDVTGSMELAEQLDPEAWSQIMQRFFRIFSDGIERFEGFVDKFTGDGGMALFGAPVAHEDRAQRACSGSPRGARAPSPGAGRPLGGVPGTRRTGRGRGSAGGCLYNEALAQLALAAALLATDGVVPRGEIESALERADHLVASIEGSALSPRILELRGRLAAAVGDAPSSDRTLREALDLYRGIGAAGHAERLAREL